MVLEPLFPDEPPTAPVDLDRITAEAEGRCAPLFMSMPLAFVAQLDLAMLSREAGFDPDLPRTGLISIFNDVLCEGVTGTHWVFWHDRPATDFARTLPPARLVDYCDAMMSGGGMEAFGDRTMAETLHPFSAVSMPRHWRSVYALGTDEADAVYDFLDCQPGAQPSTANAGEDENISNFGDRLGGWPEDIQGHPEDEIVADYVGAEPITAPGQTPWQQLFSYGAEHWGDTRLMPSPRNGDGNTYIFA